MANTLHDRKGQIKCGFQCGIVAEPWVEPTAKPTIQPAELQMPETSTEVETINQVPDTILTETDIPPSTTEHKPIVTPNQDAVQ
jgi:hypothetical protein